MLKSIPIEQLASSDSSLEQRTAVLGERDDHTRQQEEELYSHVLKSWGDAVSLINNSGPKHGWEKVFFGMRPDVLGKDRHIQLWKKQIEVDGKTFYVFKTMAKLRCEAWRVIQLNVDYNYERKRKWEDDDLKKTVLVKKVFRAKTGREKPGIKLSDRISIIDSYIQPVEINVPLFGKTSIFDPRRFLISQWLKKVKTQWVLMSRSLSEDFTTTKEGIDRYPVDPKFANAISVTGFAAIVAKPDSNQPKEFCHVTTVAYISPGGMIPDSIVDSYANKFMERLETYEKMCQEAMWKFLGFGTVKDFLRSYIYE